MDSAKALTADLKALQVPADAIFLQRFFKTGPGEYGEGDMFLGVRVPQTRKVVSKYVRVLTIDDLQELLNSKWHEVRLAAVIAMRAQFVKANAQYQNDLFNLYVSHIGKSINNWDIIDISCPHIVGAFVYDNNDIFLFELAQKSLWHKRVSIISTFWHLKQGDPTVTYSLAEILVYEQHDLLQKAVGWALREMGKCDGQLLRQFLDTYAATMPRTALRYALEHVPKQEKVYYMQLKSGVIK